MGIFDAILLGIVQGLTEFIPVSSSGHLILARESLGLSLEGSLAFDAVLHFATALAVLVYFRRDIWGLLTRAREHTVLWLALILGTVPAVVFGLLFGDFIEMNLRSSFVVASSLVAGALLFVVAEVAGKQNSGLSGIKGFFIGVFQSFALIPGVSRAGASISGGMLFGLTRESATRFAFLLGFPVLLGAGAMKLIELFRAGGTSGESGVVILTASVVSFLIGLGAIHFMLEFLRTHKLYVFAVYRVALAFLVLWFL